MKIRLIRSRVLPNLTYFYRFVSLGSKIARKADKTDTFLLYCQFCQYFISHSAGILSAFLPVFHRHPADRMSFLFSMGFQRRHSYFTRLLPVISAGFFSPIRSSRVGAMSQSFPPSESSFGSPAICTRGTGKRE